MANRINIVVTLSVEGLHFWKDCNIQEVMFLRDMHRHVFRIKAKKEVRHNDRDIEIIMLKREIETFLNKKHGKPCYFGNRSCEMIAEELCEAFGLCYCEVLEDGENGAEVWV